MVDGGDITRCNMFAELCAGAGYRCGFAVEEAECVFLFSAFSSRGVQAEMWVGWHARMPACTFGVLSAGCAVIHSVTVNTYCEKENELPHVLSQRLVTAPLLRITHTHAAM